MSNTSYFAKSWSKLRFLYAIPKSGFASYLSFTINLLLRQGVDVLFRGISRCCKCNLILNQNDLQVFLSEISNLMVLVLA